MGKVIVKYNINWEKVNSLYKIVLITETPLSNKEANKLGYYTYGGVEYYRKNIVSWSFDESSQYIPSYLINLYREQSQPKETNNFNMKISTSGSMKILKSSKKQMSLQSLKIAAEILKKFNEDMNMTYTPYQRVKVK